MGQFSKVLIIDDVPRWFKPGLYEIAKPKSI